MNKYESIEEVLSRGADGEVVRRRKNPLLPLIVMLAGTVLSVWSLGSSSLAEQTDLSSALVLAGGIVALSGVIGTVMRLNASAPVFGPTGQRIRKFELYYDSADRQALCAAVEAADAEALTRIPRTAASGGVLMTVYATDGGDFAMAQVAQYIPHSFEPVTAAVRFDEGQGRVVAATV